MAYKTQVHNSPPLLPHYINTPKSEPLHLKTTIFLPAKMIPPLQKTADVRD